MGSGGAGSVWSVQDRVTGERLALKLVHEGASVGELDALVREASALAALSQAGLPGVRAIGLLPGTHRRYLVRELVEGISLDDVLESDLPWLGAFLSACDQLALLHRAGSLHGDIKPANVIVSKSGRGCLVDLGLSAPLTLGGTRTLGLTPRFAAPELLEGERLTVRAEVYSVGATLRDCVARRGDELREDLRLGLTRAVNRAISLQPAARHPSVDEFLAEIAAVPGVELPARSRALVWRVDGISDTVRGIADSVRALQHGQILGMWGPTGSGRSTLGRELAWSFAAGGEDVVHIVPAVDQRAELQSLGAKVLAIYAEELAARPDAVLVVDDFDRLSEESRMALLALQEAKHRAVLVGHDAHAFGGLEIAAHYEVQPLSIASQESLVRTAIPSASRTAVLAIVDHAKGRPGALRELVERCAGSAMVSRGDVERAKFGAATHGTQDWNEVLRLALNSGRFAAARVALQELEKGAATAHAFERCLGEVRVRIAQGDNEGAGMWLGRAEAAGASRHERVEVHLYRARLMLRSGDYDGIEPVLSSAVSLGEATFELRVVAALAQAMARPTLQNVAVLHALHRDMSPEQGPRARAIAAGSLAIAEQRAGDTEAARAHYAEAVVNAEEAGDGWVLCSTYVNSAGLAHVAGQMVDALRLCEAAIDLAERLGADLAAYTATLNLIAFNLQLGRYERAAKSIGSLEDYDLSPYADAQLYGLRAELLERGLNWDEASVNYTQCAERFRAIGMHADACEAELNLLSCDTARAQIANSDLERRLEALRLTSEEAGATEIQSLWNYVAARVMRRVRGPHEGLAAYLTAADVARKSSSKELLWQALQGVAEAHRDLGAPALGHRAATEALEVLEAIALPLPRDLCEVFWNDVRRSELRGLAASPSLGGVSVGAPTVGAASSMAMQHLIQSARALVRVHDPERVLHDTLEHAVAIVGGVRGMLYYRDPLGRPAWVTPYNFEPAQNANVRARLEQCADSGEVQLSAEGDAGAFVCMPIPRTPMQVGLSTTVGGLNQGAIYVQTASTSQTRLNENAGVLAALLAQAAAVLDTARLVARLKRQKERVSELLDKRSRSLHSSRAELRAVRSELKESQSFGAMVGSSKPMRMLFEAIRRVAPSDIPVLVRGESGTGKELVARALHEASPRKDAPFVAINCAAIPASVLEGELFGYRKGAFTGATRDHEGLALAARDGTFFLDEVGEMPLAMQAAMLRVLQERVVRPLGSSDEVPMRARVIAATHRDLAAMVREGTFREDLYYRIEVVTLHVPSLRERREDIGLLADSFLRRASVAHNRPRKTLSRSARELLMSAPWPGNVRQLEHTLTSAVLFSDDETLHAADLNLVRADAETPMRLGTVPSGKDVAGLSSQLCDKERCLQALEVAGGNRVRAASALGIPRRTFYRRLAELGIGAKISKKA